MISKADSHSLTHSKVHKQLGEESIFEYKLLLLGDGGVGNSTLLRRFKSFGSDQRYVYYNGATVLPLTFITSQGKITLNIWDFPKNFRQFGFRDHSYIGTDCAMIMFDVTARITYKNVPVWYRDICRVCEKIPVILVGNKIDSPDKHVKARHVTFGKKRCLDYFEMSAKANYNIIEPFRELMRKLVGDPELEILESPELELPEKEIISKVIATLMDEKHGLSYSPPHSDDDDDIL